MSLIVQKQSGDNTVEVVRAVTKRLDELRGIVPADIRTFVVKDQSKFIKRSFEEVQFHLIIAAVLVAATIMLFLGDWRTTIIASLAIPASIIATFAFMKCAGLHAGQHDDAGPGPGDRHRDRRRRGHQREHLPPHGGIRPPGPGGCRQGDP